VRLDEGLAAFIQGGVSIVAAARASGNRPTIARASGCRVSPDGSVRLFVARSQAEDFLRGVAESRAIAAVFSEPRTHRTYQLKGSDAALAPLAPGDAALIEEYVDAFSTQLARLGYARDAILAVVRSDPADFVAVSFTPSQAFDQTPGPKAGAALAGKG
jgi:hypothetical protein